MKTITKYTLVLMMALMVQMFLTACSDDAPQREDTQQTEEWRKDLRQCEMFLSHLRPTGYDRDWACRFVPAMQIVDQDGNDLMGLTNPNNVINSDFYFEYEGKKYSYGDTFPVAGLSKKVDTHNCMDYHSLMLSPFSLEWQEIAEMNEPLDITYDFVWPSRNIRHTMRTYIEPNMAFKQIFAAFQSDPEAANISPEVYKYGMWVDGVSYPPVSTNLWFKIVVNVTK